MTQFLSVQTVGTYTFRNFEILTKTAMDNFTIRLLEGILMWYTFAIFGTNKLFGKYDYFY